VFAGYGYGGNLTSAEAVAPEASFNRLQYRRKGITEWYVNGPVGIEQGFTVDRPSGKTNGQPLTIALALSENLNVVDDCDPASTKTHSNEFRGLHICNHLTVDDGDL
jgi:hypothetical protein